MEMIYGTALDKRFDVVYDREIFYGEDGENQALDWIKETEEEKLKIKPIVVLLPGLTGHSGVSYIK